MRALLLLTVLYSSALIHGEAEEIYSNAYRLEHDHWLWIERIARIDAAFEPEGYDFDSKKIQRVEKQAAQTAYERCGIVLKPGEMFLYSATTTLMIAKLSEQNHQRLDRIHRTIAKWKAGKLTHWELDWMARP